MNHVDLFLLVCCRQMLANSTVEYLIGHSRMEVITSCKAVLSSYYLSGIKEQGNYHINALRTLHIHLSNICLPYRLCRLHISS